MYNRLSHLIKNMFKKIVLSGLVLIMGIIPTSSALAGGSTATVNVDSKNSVVVAGENKIQVMKFSVSPSYTEAGALELENLTLFCTNGQSFKTVWVERNSREYDSVRYANNLNSNNIVLSLKDELIVSTGIETFEIYASLTNTNLAYTAECKLIDLEIKSLVNNEWLNDSQIYYANNIKSTIKVEAGAADNDVEDEYDSNNDSQNDNSSDNDNSNDNGEPVVLNNNTVPPPNFPPTFIDVNYQTPYGQAIAWAKANGIAKGYQDGSFRPYECVNRVEFLKFVLADNNIPNVVYPQALPFWDVSQTAWYTPYLTQALNRGIINGYPDGSFKPYNCVSRSEAVKMAVIAKNGLGQVQVFNSPLSNLPVDIALDDWYSPYILFAFEYNFLGTLHLQFGPNGAYYQPNASMTRGEVVEMLYRMDRHNLNSQVVYPRYYL